MAIDGLIQSLWNQCKRVLNRATINYSIGLALLVSPVGCNDRTASSYQNPDASVDAQVIACEDNDQDGFYSTEKCGTTVDCNDADASVWQAMSTYSDLDNDGFGAGNINQLCAGLTLPPLFSLNNQDCDDYNFAIRPGRQELCDNIDNDCDATTVDGSGEAAPLNLIQYGVCLGAQQLCINGAWTDNYISIKGYEPKSEVSCDGLDNDC
ncbi:MAG: putative metal-binding motif-containing protein, partial [Nanoarchaeota archaeon]|nr:putative metal-binding motif-containing protein [Nanoarchaeota archaeon]